MSSSLIAYKVTESSEDYSVVVFARDEAQACRRGADELNGEEEGMSCERAPEFDGYADQGRVPLMALIEHGWWYECGFCQRRISTDAQSDLDAEHEADPAFPEPRMAPEEHEGELYCNAGCWDARLKERQAWVTKRADAKAAVLARWPGVTVVDLYTGSHMSTPTHAVFQLPGFEDARGRVGWTVGTETVQLTPDLVDAFRAYQRSLEQQHD